MDRLTQEISLIKMAFGRCALDDIQDRLFLIAQAAENWMDSGGPAMSNNEYEKNFAGTSMKELLNAKHIDIDKIQFFGTRFRLSIPEKKDEQ